VTVHGKVCRQCGWEGLLWNAGQCDRCYLRELVDQKFADTNGDISDHYRPLCETIVAVRSPSAAIRWLSQSPVAEKISAMARTGRDVQYADFLQRNPDRDVTFGRDLLLGIGIIEAPADDVTDLKFWLDKTMDRYKLDDRQRRTVVKKFANWAVFRDFKRLIKNGSSRESSLRFAKHCLREAIRFLLWFPADRDIASCVQVDIDIYFSQSRSSTRDVIKFLRWCFRMGIVGVKFRFPKVESLENDIAGEEARLAIVTRLLTDDTLELQTRVAGALVCLYGQFPGRLRYLKKTDVFRKKRSGVVTIRGTRNRKELAIAPEIGDLIWDLAKGGAPHKGFASAVANPWLFEGFRPGKNISEPALRTKLKAIGIRVGEMRGAALIDLGASTELTLLADVLDISDGTAFKWWSRAGKGGSKYVSMRLQRSV
jgi:hypothetical protein